MLHRLLLILILCLSTISVAAPCHLTVIDELVATRSEEADLDDETVDKRTYEKTLTWIFELLLQSPEQQASAVAGLTLRQTAALGRNLVLMNTYFVRGDDKPVKNLARFPRFVLEAFVKTEPFDSYDDFFQRYSRLPATHILKRFSAALMAQQPGTAFNAMGCRKPITESLGGCAQLRIWSLLQLVNAKLVSAPPARRRALCSSYEYFSPDVWRRNTAIVRGFFSPVYSHVPDPGYYLNQYRDALYGLDGRKAHERIEKVYEGKDLGDNEAYLSTFYELFSSPYADIEIGLQYLGLKPGQTVVDIGSGYGRVGFAIGSRHPGVRFIGYELIPERAELSTAIARANGFKNFSIRVQDVSQMRRIASADVYYFYEPTNSIALDGVLDALEPVQFARQGRIRILAKSVGGPLLSGLRKRPWLRETGVVLSGGDVLYYVFEGTSQEELGHAPRRFFENWFHIENLRPLSDDDLQQIMYRFRAEKAPARLLTDDIQSLVLDRLADKIAQTEKPGVRTEIVREAIRVFEIRKLSDPLFKRRFYQIVKRLVPDGQIDGELISTMSVPLPLEMYADQLAECELYRHDPKRVARILSEFESLPVRSGATLRDRLQAIINEPAFQAFLETEERFTALYLRLAANWDLEAVKEEAIFDAFFDEIRKLRDPGQGVYRITSRLNSRHVLYDSLPVSRNRNVRSRLREFLTSPAVIRYVRRYEFTREELRAVFTAWGMRIPDYLRVLKAESPSP